MWQRACYEQSNVLDVTIQCQFNVSTKNVAEFTSMYSPPQGSHETASRHPAGNGYQSSVDMSPSPSSAYGHVTSQDCCLYENSTPKRGYQCDYETLLAQRYHGDYDSSSVPRGAFAEHDSSRYGYNNNDCADFCGAGSDFSGLNQPCMNDSGYGSPHSTLSQQRNNDSAFSPCVSTSVFDPVKTVHSDSLYNQCNEKSSCVTYPAPEVSLISHIAPALEQPTVEMKIAMRERDVMRRLFSLRTAGVDGANDVDQYYQSQSTVIDIERHNVLCQMAYDRKSSESIQRYYNRKLMSLLECIEEKLIAIESKKQKCGKRHVDMNAHAEKKSRLLPKHAIKVMETWYKENLENPYPSRETTLSMASEGCISVEQIRKWFANKRNRSRNGKLKASDVDGGEEC